ncbi:zinc finger SWIM domain-containing protein 8-like [Watersipora subatra]|uniref:zinc finger SWIM domain-containing protein 8-like n=1 Tax=Watersipora subatra TaxID=2589382 RepID=UPI00355B224A
MDNFFHGAEGDGDRCSFDSDGYYEESLGSETSEPECNVWRGWTWKSRNQGYVNTAQRSSNGNASSLIEIAAKAVAASIPFAVVESYSEPIPEDLQLKIAFWSFPNSEEDIRLYSCLANGSPEEYAKGEALHKAEAVKDAIQIGFHLSGMVCPPQTSQSNRLLKDGYRTSVVFDRQRITANNCTCEQSAWCQHIVALCLHRINKASQVKLRAPISESLGRLGRSQLQKFAQYLIHELQDRQILPTAQRLLDELLATVPSAINNLDGAPDPTAGPDGDSHAAWYMDQRILHENIKKTLVRFCVPSPVVYSDLNCLSSSAPPAAAEYQSLLRPLRGREPEGIWNLLSIVKELLHRRDSNAVPLLEILTDEMLQCEQLLVWWFTTKISSAHNSVVTISKNGSSNGNTTQNAASSLCDEIVTLWRLVALNPRLSPLQRDDLRSQLETWHIMSVDKVRNAKCNNSSKKDDIELFPGFKPAFEVTHIDWTDYSIDGVTYSETQRTIYESASAVPGQTCLTSDGACAASKISPVTNYKVDNSKYSFANEQGFRRPGDAAEAAEQHHEESSGSEGFCEERGAEAELGDPEGASDWSDEGIRVNINRDGYTAADDDSDLDMSAPLMSATNSPPSAATVEGSQLGAAAALPLRPLAADAYNVYQYDPSLRIDLPLLGTGTEEPNYFAGIKKWDDEKEVLFARAEALHAHGYITQSCELASTLALDMLAEADDPLDGKTVKRRRSSPVLSSSICFNNTPLAKTAFLCTVLLEDTNYQHLAFKIGMYGLEMHRDPAASKALEVKLANQESELVGLLKRIPLGPAELGVLRERAEQIRDGNLMSRGEAYLPLMLTTFIFESLSLPAQSNGGGASAVNSRPPSRSVQVYSSRLPTDEQLGFDAAVAALGLKANISEAQHPLICEGTRRQKGDLAISLLVQYKEDQYKLDKILEKLLDKSIHQLFKAPPISSYLTPGAGVSSGRASSRQADITAVSSGFVSMTLGELRGDNVVRPRVYRATRPTSNSLEERREDDLDCKMLEAKLRCGLYGRSKRPSVGMAAVDSSAPETTSSDNSPTVVRRSFAKHMSGGAGSDSESSGRSSDSVGSGSSMPRPQRTRNTDSPSLRYQYNVEPRSMKSYPFRGKGKTKMTPTEPNQPSEAFAHFMFELAKTLLQKAGGTSSTSLFTHRENTAQTGTHRLLHLCAFQVGLYALGINNCVSKNWLSRTYSSHVSWITGQAMELGTVAINILLDTWEGHLTPTEVATLTDRASRGRDPNMVRAAAELALSCLAHAQALNPQETRRALVQCKEQSNSMMEKACLAVESAAKDGGVSPEVLFDVARRWYTLHEETRQGGADSDVPVTVQQPVVCNNLTRQNTSSPRMQMASNTEQHSISPQANSLPTMNRGFPGAMQANANYTVYNSSPTYNLSCYPVAPSQYLSYTYPPGQVPVTAPGSLPLASFPYNQHPAFQVPQMAVQMQPPSGVYPLYNAHGQPSVASNMLPVGQQGLTAGQMVPQHGGATLHAHHMVPDQVNYVLAAFRVGTLAMETYGRRVVDDRTPAKYNRNPPCKDDIKWLLSLAIKLGNTYNGPSYLQQFCQIAVNSLFSPFILYDIAVEVASYQTRNNPAQYQSVFRTPVLSSLMQKCLQMYIQCAHHRIHHIQSSDYDEFVGIVCAARKAFSTQPSGMVQFQEMLQGLRRNKSCKKELWSRMMSGLALPS